MKVLHFSVFGEIGKTLIRMAARNDVVVGKTIFVTDTGDVVTEYPARFVTEAQVDRACRLEETLHPTKRFSRLSVPASIMKGKGFETFPHLVARRPYESYSKAEGRACVVALAESYKAE